jgi:predicted GH43/DUF377 family glycosyl hydrolase
MQVGNCGSPLETDEGRIVITHGVGPMRQYCIGAMLLALENPTKIIARLDEPLLAPYEKEREGYVPYVVYFQSLGRIANAVWTKFEERSSGSNILRKLCAIN